MWWEALVPWAVGLALALALWGLAWIVERG